MHCAGKALNLRGDCPCGGGRPCRLMCILPAACRRGRSAWSGACFLFFFRRMGAVARHWGVVASRRGAGGRGLRSPLPPTTPNPALRQPSLTVLRNKSAVLLPPLCRAAAGVRTPAVPRRRGTSVRPASELPPLRGGDLLRALPRLHQQSSRFIFSHKWHVIPGCRAEKTVFPLLIPCAVPESR